MLADGQDLVGSYIILHLSLVNAQLRGAVYYIYIHIHVTMNAWCPPTQYTTRSSLLCEYIYYI